VKNRCKIFNTPFRTKVNRKLSKNYCEKFKIDPKKLINISGAECGARGSYKWKNIFDDDDDSLYSCKRNDRKTYEKIIYLYSIFIEFFKNVRNFKGQGLYSFTQKSGPFFIKKPNSVRKKL